MVSPKDAEPVGAVWLEQLDRFEVSPELYDLLLNKAIDYRVGYLKCGENPPALTVELLLAKFAEHKTETQMKVNGIDSMIRSYQTHDLPSAQRYAAGFVMQGDLRIASMNYHYAAKPEEEQRADFEKRKTDVIRDTNLRHKQEFTDISEVVKFFENKLNALNAERIEILTKAHLPTK